MSGYGIRELRLRRIAQVRLEDEAVGFVRLPLQFTINSDHRCHGSTAYRAMLGTHRERSDGVTAYVGFSALPS